MIFLQTFVKCDFVINNFDIWISKGAHDVFALVINILGVD
jgi:hypothetical protein